MKQYREEVPSHAGNFGRHVKGITFRFWSSLLLGEARGAAKAKS